MHILISAMAVCFCFGIGTYGLGLGSGGLGLGLKIFALITSLYICYVVFPVILAYPSHPVNAQKFTVTVYFVIGQ